MFLPQDSFEHNRLSNLFSADRFSSLFLLALSCRNFFDRASLCFLQPTKRDVLAWTQVALERQKKRHNKIFEKFFRAEQASLVLLR
jgi:hypothetical protein